MNVKKLKVVSLIATFLACSLYGSEELELGIPAGILKYTAAPFTGGRINDVKIDSNGKIVACGYGINASNGLTYGIIARFNSNGSLDTTFNSTGYNVHATAGNYFVKLTFQGTNIVALGQLATVRYTNAGAQDASASFDSFNKWSCSINYNGTLTRFFTTIAWGGGTEDLDPSTIQSDNSFGFIAFYNYNNQFSTTGGTAPTKGDNIFLSDNKGFLVWSRQGSAPATVYYKSNGSSGSGYQNGTFLNTSMTGGTRLTRIDDNQIFSSCSWNGVQGICKLNSSLSSILATYTAVVNNRTDFPYGLGGGVIVTDTTSTSSIVNCGCDDSQQLYIARFLNNGNLDTSFNTSGVNTQTSLTVTPGMYQAVDILSNGKVIAGGFTTSASGSGWVLARYNTNGTLDGTFTSTQGVLQDTASPFNTGSAGLITTTTIDQSSKLVVAGNYGTKSQITRYNLTGTPARSSGSGFGTNGVVLGSLVDTAVINKVINNGTGYLAAGVSNTDQFTVAAYTSSGAANTSFNATGTVVETLVGVSAAYDMLLNGTALAVCGYVYTNTPVVINYNSTNGARDAAFYNNGVQQFPFLGNGRMYGISTTTGASRYGAGQGTSSNTAFMQLLVDGTGLLQDTAAPFNTGQSGLIYSTTLTQTGNILAAVAYNSTWQVVNYLPNATRNTSFGTTGNGLANEPGFVGSARPRAIAIDNVGRIVATGTSMVLTTSYITLVRYNADGTVDTYVQETTLPSGGSGLGLLVNSDDSIAVAGYVDPGTGPTPIVINYDSDLARLNVHQYDALIPGYFFAIQITGLKMYAAGASEDTALLYPLRDGTGLLQDTAAPFNTNQNAVIYGGCIDQDDNITMCGNYNNIWTVVKYTGVGDRYVGFGSNGVILDSSLGAANAYAVIQDADGNYFVAGQSTVNGVTVLTVAKYANDGSPVTAFGVNGIAQLTRFGPSRAFNLALTSDGGILVVGQVTINGIQYAAFVAYDVSGNLISSFGSGGVQTYSQFGPGSLYANLVNMSGSAIGAGQMGNSATLVQIAEESLAALYIHSGL